MNGSARGRVSTFGVFYTGRAVFPGVAVTPSANNVAGGGIAAASEL